MNPSQLAPPMTPVGFAPASMTPAVIGGGHAELQSLQAEVVQLERMVKIQKMDASQQDEGVVVTDLPPTSSHTWLVGAFLAIVGMGGAFLRSISPSSGGHRDSASARSRLAAPVMKLSDDAPPQSLFEEFSQMLSVTSNLQLAPGDQLSRRRLLMGGLGGLADFSWADS